MCRAMRERYGLKEEPRPQHAQALEARSGDAGNRTHSGSSSTSSSGGGGTGGGGSGG
jgi:hypothetical protein